MFLTGVGRINLRVAALAGGLAMLGLGCGRYSGEKRITTSQSIPSTMDTGKAAEYILASTPCGANQTKEPVASYADKLKTANSELPNPKFAAATYDGNSFIPFVNLSSKFITIHGPNPLCESNKPEPAASASAIATAPIPTVSAPVPSATASTVKTSPSTGKGQQVPVPSTTTTKGGYRP